MTETLKLNLDRTFLFLKITSIVAGALIACAVVYGQIDNRIDNLEKSDAVEKERSRNMNEKINQIYDIVRELRNDS